jgi:membrane protein
MKHFKTIFICVKKTVENYAIAAYRAAVSLVAHDGVEHAGYLSFLIMLSIFPFIVLLVAVTGLIGEEGLNKILLEVISGDNVAVFMEALRPRIVEITSAPPDSLLTFVLLSAVWTASSIFEASRTALNKACAVTSPPSYPLRRLVSIVEFSVTFIALLFLLSLMLIVPSTIEHFDKIVHIRNIASFMVVAEIISFLHHALLIFTGFLFLSLIYHFLPNRRDKKYKNTVPGTIIVLLLWSAAVALLKFYVKYFTQLNFIYGSIAGIIIALIFFYLCSLIFIYGAEINYHLEKLKK